MNAKGRRRQRREAQRTAEKAEQAAEQAAQNARFAPAPEGRAGAIETQNLQAQAIRERWPIRPAARPAIMDRLTKVALDPATLPQFVIQAARAHFDADKINFEQEKRDTGGEQVNVNVQGQVNVTQRTELDITVRIDQYLAEYDALAHAAALDAGPPLASINGSNGLAQQLDPARANHQTNGVSGAH